MQVVVLFTWSLELEVRFFINGLRSLGYILIVAIVVKTRERYEIPSTYSNLEMDTGEGKFDRTGDSLSPLITLTSI